MLEAFVLGFRLWGENLLIVLVGLMMVCLSFLSEEKEILLNLERLVAGNCCSLVLYQVINT